MIAATLQVRDDADIRRVSINKPVFRIGRGPDNDLVLPSTEVSRDHASIALEDGEFVLRDHPSKLGTFVNGERVTTRRLVHGDRIHLGGPRGIALSFQRGSSRTAVTGFVPAAASAIVDVGHVAALLSGLRALGGGRVLDDVLALVLDAALVVSDAERGFVMLATGDGRLEFKLARGRGGEALSDSEFRSHRVPDEVYATGSAQYGEDVVHARDDLRG